MPENINRRSFIQGAFCAAAGSLAMAQSPAGKQTLKTSLNAYSFNKMLNDRIKGRGEGITLLQVMEFAAKNKFDGFDATGYFFPGYPERPTDAYIDELKKRAADLGVGISGTGVRNNFTTADKRSATKGVAPHQGVRRSGRKARRAGDSCVRRHADARGELAIGVERRHPGSRCWTGSPPTCKSAPITARSTASASACKTTATSCRPASSCWNW